METEAVARVLGGRKVLDRAIKNPDGLARLVRNGLAARSVAALASSGSERGVSAHAHRLRLHVARGTIVYRARLRVPDNGCLLDYRF